MTSPLDSTKKKPRDSISDKLSRIDGSFQSYLDPVVLVILAVGFLIRAVIASKSYFNPDEALYYLLVNQPSLFAGYEASLTNAHPPLYYFLIYFWRSLGNSEFVLRLPSVLAGTAFPWVAFKWLGSLFGKTTGLIALLFLTFSPAMIALSAEVRPYAFLLLFMAGALFSLERAFQEDSPRTMMLFSLFLYLAILTHYSALWFTLALGIYSCLRILAHRPKRSVIGVWVATQAGAAALYAGLYVTHISKLRGSSMEQIAMRDNLYFHPDRDRFLSFALQRTLGVFQYAFAHKELGIAMFVLFLLGVGVLLAKGGQSESSKVGSREFAALLLLPFVIGCAGAIAGLYPYGDSRRDVYLGLFAIAGISVLLAHLPGKKLWPGLLAAVVALLVSHLDGSPTEFILPENQNRILMSQAVDYIHRSILPPQPILVDYETSLMLRYYLCRRQSFPADPPDTASLEFPCGGYRLVSTGRNLFQFAIQDFPAAFNGLASISRLTPGENAWVAHIGWGENLDKELAMEFPWLDSLPHRNFGENISIFRVTVGSELSTPRRQLQPGAADSSQ